MLYSAFGEIKYCIIDQNTIKKVYTLLGLWTYLVFDFAVSV